MKKMNVTSLIHMIETPAAQIRQVLVWAWGGGHGPWGWWSCPAFGGWGASWTGMIMTYGLWGLVIAVLILLIRRLGLSGRPGVADAGVSFQAMEILKQRYAKGEITEEEFRRMKTNLQ